MKYFGFSYPKKLAIYPKFRFSWASHIASGHPTQGTEFVVLRNFRELEFKQPHAAGGYGRYWAAPSGAGRLAPRSAV